jgi:acetoin:2,6-dichlorophenolindophenol oxidoreductase subunit beta
MRRLKYYQAINEALAQCLEADPSVLVLGLGVPGPTGIFGTTSGLVDRFGKDRVLDMPSSEQGMTGIALGMTIAGFRPVMVHMRVDFATLAMDQMVNQVAKWHFMYGGKMRAPMVFRMIIGRGWGQGPQHSQSLQAWFAHTPGFKVVMPTTAHDVKGMLIAAVRDDAPVVLFEHRWLYSVEGDVPQEPYEVPLDKAKVLRRGRDVTIAATSYMVLEALRAADILATIGVEVEVVDLRCLVPLDTATIVDSVKLTRALVVADTGTTDFGISAEIVSRVVEADITALKYSPRRVGLPFCPSPTSPALAEEFFPRATHIVGVVAEMLGVDATRLPPEAPAAGRWHDVPDPSFTGPY